MMVRGGAVVYAVPYMVSLSYRQVEKTAVGGSCEKADQCSNNDLTTRRKRVPSPRAAFERT